MNGVCFLELELPEVAERDGLIIEARRVGDEWKAIALLPNGDTFVEGTELRNASHSAQLHLLPVYCDFRSKKISPIFDEPGDYELRVKWYAQVGVYPAKEPVISEIAFPVMKMTRANEVLFTQAVTLDWQPFDIRDIMTTDMDVIYRGWIAASFVIAAATQGWDVEKFEPHVRSLERIARENKQSQFAPYFAFLAAKASVERKERLVSGSDPLVLPNKRIAEVATYQTAIDLLEYAEDCEDPILKSKAVCELAILRAWAGDFDNGLVALGGLTNRYGVYENVSKAIANARNTIIALQATALENTSNEATP